MQLDNLPYSKAAAAYQIPSIKHLRLKMPPAYVVLDRVSCSRIWLNFDQQPTEVWDIADNGVYNYTVEQLIAAGKTRQVRAVIQSRNDAALLARWDTAVAHVNNGDVVMDDVPALPRRAGAPVRVHPFCKTHARNEVCFADRISRQ